MSNDSGSGFTFSKQMYPLIRLIPYLILFIAICFIIIGLYNGDYYLVLRKASHICMRCIGIG
ncbi:MAG: hypothetical protein GX362_05665 [Methanosarcinaceae archaeon]|nr:hypothetical protein [Methanosarcinaceae archaeon]